MSACWGLVVGLGVASFGVVFQNLALLGSADELRIFGLGGLHAGGGLLGIFPLSPGVGSGAGVLALMIFRG